MKNFPYTVALLAFLSPLASPIPFRDIFSGATLNPDPLNNGLSDADLSFRTNARMPDPGELTMQGGFLKNDGWEKAQQNWPGQHNLCLPSRFRPSETNPSSPLARDCLAIAEGLWAGGAHMITTLKWGPSAHQKLFTVGTCSFGVHVRSIMDSFWLYGSDITPTAEIGNMDMIEAIEQSVKLFQSPSGRVGAQGVMACHNPWGDNEAEGRRKIQEDYVDRNIGIVWQIYHSAGSPQWW